MRYLATLDGEPLGEISLPVPGRHLGLNSAAAVLTALGWACRCEPVADALAAFPGVRRRFELKGVADGVRVYDEYAYHPTSMTAALQTLREVAGDGRLMVVFQPYRVYRTRDLQAEIAAALALADEVVVLEVFGPGEVREPGEGGVALTARSTLPRRAQGLRRRPGTTCAGEVVRRARAGDVVVTMGAPPISLMGDELLDGAGARAARYACRRGRRYRRPGRDDAGRARAARTRAGEAPAPRPVGGPTGPAPGAGSWSGPAATPCRRRCAASCSGHGGGGCVPRCRGRSAPGCWPSRGVLAWVLLGTGVFAVYARSR